MPVGLGWGNEGKSDGAPSADCRAWDTAALQVGHATVQSRLKQRSSCFGRAVPVLCLLMLLMTPGCQVLPLSMNAMVPTKTTVASGHGQAGNPRVEIDPTVKTTAGIKTAVKLQTPTEPITPATDELPPELPPAIERPTAALASSAEVELPPASSIFQPTAGAPQPKAEELQRIMLDSVESASAAKPAVSTSAPSLKAPIPAAPSKPVSPESAAAALAVPPKTPDQVWRERADELLIIARQQASGAKGAGADVWNFRARLVAWLVEPVIDPDSTSTQQLASWRSFLKALQSISSQTVDSGDSRSEARSADIREAVRALEAHAPLEMTDLALSRKVSGFGDYEKLDPPARKPGQSVIVYVELEGLTFESAPEGFRSRVASRVEILQDRSGPPVWSMTLGTAEDHCKRKRRDFYVNNRFTLPDTLKPGQYWLRSSQTDLISGKTVSREVALAIQP